MLSKRNFYWICQIGGWMFYVLLNAVFKKLLGQLNSSAIISLVFLLIFGVLLSHIYRNFIFQHKWFKLGAIKLIPRILLATIFLATVLQFIEFTISIFDFEYTQLLQFNFIEQLAQVINFAFVFFFWSLIYFLFHSIENNRKTEIANLKWEASIVEVELNKLKSQLNPHFVFNSMNSIKALVDENPQKAKDSIVQLSNILRNSLQMGKDKLISFEEEFKIVKDYLELETTRFEERLQIRFDIDDRSNKFKVPPLMIQTLVENGIKHGISKLTNGGEISITAKTDNEFIKMYIRNSGQIEGELNTENGFGIKNSVQRLKLLFGNRASLKVFNENEKMVLTELIIPFVK